jgi:hypothetical protein
MSDEPDPVSTTVTITRPMRPQDYQTPTGINWPAAIAAGLMTLVVVALIVWLALA